MRVSMPSTGFYLFPRGKELSTRSRMKSVNALNGLLLISSVSDYVEEIVEKLCQCPQRASTYFFLLVAHMDTVHKECVSMPSTGFYLFLLSAWMVLGCSRVSVNALNGLLLISSAFFMFAGIIGKVCQCPQRASTYFFRNV